MYFLAFPWVCKCLCMFCNRWNLSPQTTHEYFFSYFLKIRRTKFKSCVIFDKSTCGREYVCPECPGLCRPSHSGDRDRFSDPCCWLGLCSLHSAHRTPRPSEELKSICWTTFSFCLYWHCIVYWCNAHISPVFVRLSPGDCVSSSRAPWEYSDLWRRLCTGCTSGPFCCESRYASWGCNSEETSNHRPEIPKWKYLYLDNKISYCALIRLYA